MPCPLLLSLHQGGSHPQGVELYLQTLYDGHLRTRSNNPSLGSAVFQGFPLGGQIFRYDLTKFPLSPPTVFAREGHLPL